MNEFFKLIGASFGWVKDAGAQAGNWYLEFLRKGIKVSAIVFVVGLVMFLASESSQMAIFNTFGMLAMAGIVFFWVLASQPVVALGEQLAKIDAIRRIVERVGTTFLALVLITLYSLHAPAGTDGIQRIVMVAIILAGALALGLQLNKRTMGVKLILVGVLVGISIYLPQTMSRLPRVGQLLDTEIAKSIMPSADELNITLANLRGDGANAPRLFLDGDALWWCRRAAEKTAGYRCFDQPGRDQTTNEELQEISETMVLEMTNRLEAERLRQEAETAVRATEERQRVEKERLNRIRDEAEATKRAENERILGLQEERAAYISRYINPIAPLADFGIGVQENGSLNDRVAQEIGRAATGSVNPHVFKDLVTSDGVFSRLFGGESAEFGKLNLSNVARELLLINLSVAFSENSAIRGTINASVELNARLVNTESAATTRSFSGGSVGLGRTESDAKEKAISDVIAQMAKQFGWNP